LPAQTAREFAQSVENDLQRHTQAAALQNAIDSVVDKFYWVRFSERELTDEEMQQVESSLEFLEQHLSPLSAAS
jgi:hypothetical protein